VRFNFRIAKFTYYVWSKVAFLSVCWFVLGLSKSFRTGLLERELQMVKLSATRRSFIAILWVSPASFATITLRIVSQWMFIVVSVYFVTTQSGNFWIHSRTLVAFKLTTRASCLCWPLPPAAVFYKWNVLCSEAFCIATNIHLDLHLMVWNN